MQINRTYPQPDSPREHLGPRERALNLFKYLMGIEPEEAKDHPRFELVVNAFENARRAGMRQVPGMQRDAEQVFLEPDDVIEMRPSLVEELSGSKTIDDARIRRFAGGPGRDL